MNEYHRRVRVNKQIRWCFVLLGLNIIIGIVAFSVVPY